jgi:hypothetical protein
LVANGYKIGMNQKILIVFTLFLLITILLLLLFSDAKAKSSRIRILVSLCGDPADLEITDTIDRFLAKLTAENNFIFTLAENVDQDNVLLPDSYHVLLQLKSESFSDKGNAESIKPDDRRIIQIDIGQNAAHCDEPDFLIRVRESILQLG